MHDVYCANKLLPNIQSDLPTCSKGQKYDWKTSECIIYEDENSEDKGDRDNEEDKEDGEEETSDSTSIHSYHFQYSMVPTIMFQIAVLVISTMLGFSL